MDPIALLTRMVEIPSLSGEESALAGLPRRDHARPRVSGARGRGRQRRRRPRRRPHRDRPAGPPGHGAGRDSGAREDGHLYGRGSVDAKGPLATFIAAAAEVGALPGKRIVVVGATEEEAASSKGARHIGRTRAPACCVIGEPSGTRAVTLGYKGRLVFAYQAETGASHSASPDQNVLETAVAFWNRVRRWAEARMPARRCSTRWTRSCGRCTAEATGSPKSMRSASIRIPLGQTPETVQAQIEALAATGARLRFWGADPPYRAEKNTPAGPGLPVSHSRRGTGSRVQGQEWHLRHERRRPRLELPDRGVRPRRLQPRPHPPRAPGPRRVPASHRHPGPRPAIDLSGIRRSSQVKTDNRQ